MADTIDYWCNRRVELGLNSEGDKKIQEARGRANELRSKSYIDDEVRGDLKKLVSLRSNPDRPGGELSKAIRRISQLIAHGRISPELRQEMLCELAMANQLFVVGVD